MQLKLKSLRDNLAIIQVIYDEPKTSEHNYHLTDEEALAVQNDPSQLEVIISREMANIKQAIDSTPVVEEVVEKPKISLSKAEVEAFEPRVKEVKLDAPN